MVNDARRQCIQFKVAYPVCSHQHGTLLGVELINNTLQRVLIAVEVIAVELHRETSAVGAVDSQVPATANSQVIAFGDEMQHPAVAEGVYYLARSVSRVIIHHNYIEREGCLLFQHRANRIGDCRASVQYGDNH